MNKEFEIFLTQRLNELKENLLYRTLKIFDESTVRFLRFNGRNYLNFSSNDYLGLSKHPEIIQTGIEAIKKFGSGSGASRLISGTFKIHKELEEKLAEFKNEESAIVFPTGYMTNLGVITSLVESTDCIIIDKNNHASIIDAVLNSKVRFFIYAHCDMNQLESILKKANYKKKLIITDTVFSMDGDFAPLNEITFLAQRYNAITMVDEAHATGIFGKSGSGLAEEFQVEKKIDIKMGTLSKAIGSQGGFVCGRKKLIDFIKNKARSFIYTTALNPVSCATAIKAIELIKKNPQDRKILIQISKLLREKLKKSGFNISNSQSQIIPIILGNNKRVMEVSNLLWNKKIFVPAIRYPSVKKGEERLRISLNSKLTDEDLDFLFKILVEFVYEPVITNNQGKKKHTAVSI